MFAVWDEADGLVITDTRQEAEDAFINIVMRFFPDG